MFGMLIIRRIGEHVCAMQRLQANAILFPASAEVDLCAKRILRIILQKLLKNSLQSAISRLLDSRNVL